MPSTSRENTISRLRIPQTGSVRALDIRLQLSLIIVVIITVWVLGAPGATPWLLLPAARLAGQFTVHYVHVQTP